MPAWALRWRLAGGPPDAISASATASLARVRLHEQSEPYDSDVSCVSAPQ